MVGEADTRGRGTRLGSGLLIVLALLVTAQFSLLIYLLMLYSTLAHDLVQLLFVFTSTGRSTSTPPL